MKTLLHIFVLIVSMSPFLMAQEMVVGFRVHPGDPVRVLVTFKAPVAVDSLMVRFQLNGNVQKDQVGFSPILDLRELKKVSDREYELSAKVPDKTATGRYQLAQIYVTLDNISRTYNAGPDFPGDITININDDQHSAFVDIEGVRIVR